MAKVLNIYVSLAWHTQVEVPDDFVDTPQNIAQVINDSEPDWDFADGGLEVVEVTTDFD